MMRWLAISMLLALGCDRAPTVDTKAVALEPAKATPPIETKPADPKPVEVDPKKPAPTPPTNPVLASFDRHTGGLWNDHAEGLVQCVGGGFGVVGRCEPVESGRESEWDGCVTFFDANGVAGRSARVGGTGTDEVFEAAWPTNDGGIIAVGAAVIDGAREARALRLGPDAKTQWERTWGGAGDDTALAIAATADGYVLVGSSQQPEHALDLAVWWLDGDGQRLDERTQGGAARDFAHAVAVLDDGVVVAGFTGSKGAGKDDAWVLRFDAEHNLMWERTLGTAQHDGALAMVALAGGALIVAGDSGGHGWLAKLDASGNVVVESTITTTTKIRALAQVGTEIIAVGTAKAPLGPAWMGRFDSAATLTSERVFADPRRAATDVIATDDGGIALVGNWPSLNSNYANFWLCKLDARGTGCE